MKNLYLLVGSLIIGTTVAFGQLRTQPLHSQGQKHQSLVGNNIPDAVATQPENTNDRLLESRASGLTLWSEDFGGGFPVGWAVDDVSGINPWKWSMNGSHGNFNNSSGAGYDSPITSTTAANGFLINDPDSANHATYGQPSGSTYQYLESYFATSKIELGASYPSLLLEFEQYFRMNNGVDLVVQVSADSTNWIDYNVRGNVVNNSASNDPDLVSINISGAVGTSQSLFLRIGWSARVYFWMIDDMKIVEGLGNDLAMTNVWHGDYVDALEYQQIPLAQTHELIIGAACTNLGGTAQTNAVYTYDVSNGTTSVASGTFPANSTNIGSTQNDTTWFATGLTPATLGNYTVTVSVSADSTDEQLSNNTRKSTFKMTNHIYAHDDVDNIVLQVSGGVKEGTEIANEYKIGMFYQVFANATLTAVQTAFGKNTSTSSCIVEVFDATNDPNFANALVTEVFDIASSDISPGAVPRLVNVVLNDGNGIELIAGVDYVVSVGNTGEGEELWILASDGDEDRAQLRYGPFGVANAINWYTGYTNSPLVRANFDPAVGIDERVLEESGFGIYPNPTSDIITVQFENSLNVELVSILDISGKKVKELTIKAGVNSLPVDVSNLSSGVYFVNVVSTQGTSTQKLIIK